jgi:hypothetical protein
MTEKQHFIHGCRKNRYPDYGATDLPENEKLLQISGLWRH